MSISRRAMMSTLAAAGAASALVASAKPGRAAGVTLEGVSPISDEHYVMITFLSGIEFWVPARKGMEHAAKQLGVKAVYQGTEKYDAIDEARVLDQVLAGGPTGILITAQNPDALRPGDRQGDRQRRLARDVRFGFAQEQASGVPGRRQLSDRQARRRQHGRCSSAARKAGR